MNNRQRQIDKARAKHEKQLVISLEDEKNFYFRINYGNRIKNTKLVNGMQEYWENGSTKLINVVKSTREEVENCKFCMQHGGELGCQECDIATTVKQLACSELENESKGCII